MTTGCSDADQRRPEPALSDQADSTRHEAAHERDGGEPIAVLGHLSPRIRSGEHFKKGANESTRRERGVAARQGPSLNLKAPTPGSGALFPRVHGQIRLV